MATGNASKRDVYEEVTERVVQALEEGTVPWHKPWLANGELPKSMSTNKTYRGVNVFLLALAPYSSPWWGTYRQISELGGQVRKGEKATTVVFWKMLRKSEENDQGETVEKRIPMLRTFSVFNAEQADGLGAKFYASPSPLAEWEVLDHCETLAKGYLADGPSISFGGDRAFYSPASDAVRLPMRESFENAEGYYGTLFHELTHSTGHKSRLARKELLEMHSFGDASYSREELVAEMGAAMLCGLTGLAGVTVPQHAAYIGSWLKALKNDKKLLVVAAAQAQKAADLISGTTYETEEVAA